MDPLSLTASIVAVIQITDQVLTRCYSYIGKVKNAEKDIEKVIHETSLLKGLLLNLSQLVEDNKSNSTLQSLVNPNGPISLCQVALEEINAKLAPFSAGLTTKQKLFWPFESKKLEEILERIRKQKPVLLLVLATDTANVTRDIQDDLRGIQNSLESTHLQEKREKILSWLQVRDTKDKHLNSRRAHQEGSNQWVLELKEFMEWKNEPRETIWLHGIPGCGKTVMCSTIIDHMEKYCQCDDINRLAYYYFDFNDSTNQKLAVLLRSLIFQLCCGSDHLPEPLVVLYDECNRGRSNPSEESLTELFFSILDSVVQTYIVIDGLDECPYDGQGSERDRFHDLILSGIGQYPGSYNFLFTSRKEYDIEEAMKTISVQSVLHNITIETEKVDADVGLQVRRFVSEHKRISKWSATVRREIEDELVKGSQGMFRWVDCQLQSIGGCVLPGTARKMLKQLPTTLYDSYDRILSSISEENITAVRSALMFLAHSQRPLTLEEVAEAVLISIEEQSFSSEERSDDPLSVVLGLCSSLVTVTVASPNDNASIREMSRRTFGFSSDVSIVRFAHYSVKEYVISDRNKTTELSSLYFTELDAHHNIAEALLVYLLSCGSTDMRSSMSYHCSSPLLPYAASSWPTHCRQIPSEGRQHRLIELIHRLFDTSEPINYMCWLNTNDQDYKTQPWFSGHNGRNLSDFAPPLYIAALLGEFETCRWLISNGCRIDDPSGNCKLGDPLQAASLGNHSEIVQLLLDHGSPVNTDHGHFGDPLQAAAFGGGELTVEILLDHGALVNNEHGEYGSPLIAAAQNGHLAIAKRLLEQGADVELSSRTYGKAAAAAAASGQMELLKLLLTKGNDINDPNGSKGSALYSACSSGDISIVRMLVKAGADVNLESGKLNTALQAACNEGHFDIVKFLLANGAKVNIFGGELDSALQACIDNGDLDILQMLLSHGADINHEGGLYHSPLRCAVFRGKSRAAEILLDQGALFGDEIFLLAIEQKHSSLIKRMLSKGVNVNAQDQGGTALQLAIKNDDMDTTWTLLASEEIDIEERGGNKDGPPFKLHLAGAMKQSLESFFVWVLRSMQREENIINH